MNEVIFLRFFRQIKREAACADWRLVLLFSVGTLLVGMLSAVICGAHAHRICLPRFAPSRFILWLIWTIIYLLIGAAAGIAFSAGRCGRANICGLCRIQGVRGKGLLWWAIGLLLNFLWCPLFFGAGAMLLSLLLIPLIILCAYMTVCVFVRVGLLPTLIMLLYILWLFICFFLQIAVILCN